MHKVRAELEFAAEEVTHQHDSLPQGAKWRVRGSNRRALCLLRVREMVEKWETETGGASRGATLRTTTSVFWSDSASGTYLF